MKRSCALVLAVLGLGCGLVHKDIDVSQAFTVGGSAPMPGTNFDATSITAPLASGAGDLNHLSSVTLQAVRLDSSDGMDLSFVSGGTLTVSGNGLPSKTIATLSAPGQVQSAQFSVDSSTDLKPFLAAGGQLAAVLTYVQRPAAARGLILSLTLRATVL